MTLLFAGPPEDDIDWADLSPVGMTRQLARMVRACTDAADAGGAAGAADAADGAALDVAVARAVEEVSRLTEGFRFNVAVARLMELTSALRKALDAGVAAASVRAAAESLCRLLAAYGPYTAEECWSRLGHDVEAGDSVHATTWPVADPALLVVTTATCVVQVAGKVRDRLEVAAGIPAGELERLALASEAVGRALAGRPVRTVVVRAPKLVNIVPA